MKELSDQEKASKLREEFFSQYSNKYTLLDNKALGVGHYACVFKAKDIDRSVDVAIKIFFEGIPPKGSIRGWQITSNQMHPQIAPTFTVEAFKSTSLDLECKAVVQKFIPGKPLKSLLNHFDEIENKPVYQHVLNDFGITLLNSLLCVLDYCHSNNFGHGDCHDGNIMVFMESHPTKHSFRCVLIDFDNTSFKEKFKSSNEKDKIESDIGLLRYLFRKVFYQWRYFEPIRVFLDDYSLLTEIRFGYQIVSSLIEAFASGKKSEKIIFDVLSKLPHPFMGFHVPDTIKCLKAICEVEGLNEEFESALNSYKEKISNPDAWSYNFEVEYLEESVNKIYKQMFNS